MELSGRLHTLATLPPGGKGRRYSFDTKIGAYRNEYGRFGKQQISVPAGIEPQVIVRSGRSLQLTLGQQKKNSQRSTSTARP